MTNLEQTPREIILKASVDDSPRIELLTTLKNFPYTFGEDAPYPHEGRIPGTWDQVVAAVIQELISEEEFAEIREEVRKEYKPDND